MRYNIIKSINGNVNRLHTFIPTLEMAKDILSCIASEEKKNNKVKHYSWMVRVNDNERIYQISED